MQSITTYSFNYQNRNINNKKVSFTGGPNLSTMDDVLSLKACKLIKKAGMLIDETWPKVKKKHIPAATPEFSAKKDGKNVTLKPVYNLIREALCLEVKDDKYIEKLIIDRVNPNIFRYEKAIKTDNGSATIKTYNSKNSSDSAMVSKANEMIETYFTKFVPDIPERKHYRL